MIKAFLVGAALATVLAPAACSNPPAKATQFGDGTYIAGPNGQIATGTYETVNDGPHGGEAQCEWTISRGGGQGHVDERSKDPGEKPQRVYLGNGDMITTELCGVWKRLGQKDLT